eukprot:g8494.t1
MKFFQQRRKRNRNSYKRVLPVLLYLFVICHTCILECNASFLSLMFRKSRVSRFRETLKSLLFLNKGPDHADFFGTKIDGPGLSGGPTSEGANKPGMAPKPPKGGPPPGSPPGPPPGVPGAAKAAGQAILDLLKGGGGKRGGGAEPPKTGEAGIVESKKKQSDQLAPCAGTPGAPKPCGAGAYGNKDMAQLKKNEKSIMAPLGPQKKAAKMQDEVNKYYEKAAEAAKKKDKMNGKDKEKKDKQNRAKKNRLRKKAMYLERALPAIPEENKMNKQGLSESSDEEESKDEIKKEQLLDEQNEAKEEAKAQSEVSKALLKKMLDERDKEADKVYRESIDDNGEEIVETNAPPPHAPNRICPKGLKPCDLEDFSIKAKSGPYSKTAPNTPKEENALEAKLKIELDEKERKRRELKYKQGNATNALQKTKIESEILKLKNEEADDMEKADASVVEGALKALGGVDNLSKLDNEEGYRGAIGNDDEDIFPSLGNSTNKKSEKTQLFNETDEGEWVPPENPLLFEG